MNTILIILGLWTGVLATLFVLLPGRRMHFAEVLSVSVLLLVLGGGFVVLTPPSVAAPTASPTLVASIAE